MNGLPTKAFIDQIPELGFQELGPSSLEDVTGGGELARKLGWLCGTIVNGIEWAMLTGGESYKGMYVSYSNS